VIDIDVDQVLSELDDGRFAIFSSEEQNKLFYNSINDLVISDNDKYPKKLSGYMGFDETYVSRRKSNLTNSNIVRIFDSKKSSNLIAQYSYNKEGILLDNDINAIRAKECMVYMICHTDMDGDASGSLVFNSLHYGDNVKITRFNYEYEVLDKLILDVNVEKARNPEKKFVLFIVDLSPKILYMTMLLSTFNKVVWIDHHAGSIPVVNELESGDFIKSMKTNFVTSDFSYVLDTRMSATQLALLWLHPYIKRVKETKYITGYKIAALVSVYDMKMDERFPETYQNAVYMNQFYWDYQTIYVFTKFWKDSFMEEYQIEYITRMLVAGKILWDLNQKKLKLMYKFDYIYKYSVQFENGKILHIRAIYGTGNSSRFVESHYQTDNEYEITLLIRYTNKPAILSVSGYTSDQLIKDVGINNVFGTFGLGQGHPGAAGMRISRKDMLKLATESIFRPTEVGEIPYYYPNEGYDNPKIPLGLDKFNVDCLFALDDIKEQIQHQYEFKQKSYHLRFEPEIDILVRTFTIIFAVMCHSKITE